MMSSHFMVFGPSPEERRKCAFHPENRPRREPEKFFKVVFPVAEVTGERVWEALAENRNQSDPSRGAGKEFPWEKESWGRKISSRKSGAGVDTVREPFKRFNRS
jgi:hypothetical protein